MQLSDLVTPALIVDEKKMLANIAKAKSCCSRLGVKWRPHMKTHKCIEIGKLQLDEVTQAATVSTVKEAEVFAQAGIKDLIYAVGIEPHKLPRLEALNRNGADVKVILDSVQAAKLLSEYCWTHQCRFGVLIEIDCDGHRSGLKPGKSEDILAVAEQLKNGAELVGVLTHAGGSYVLTTEEAMRRAAQEEVDAINQVAQTLRHAGYTISIVSVGSTPTLNAAQNAEGVTEYRSGVGTFFDLFMAGISVCTLSEIALSVMVTVIGHQTEKGWILTDGGWMAMSRDRGTASQAKDWGYGAVCDEAGRQLPEYYVSSANQEHCIISRFDGQPIRPEDFPIGMRFRILPNHACPTAAAFDKYYVTDGTTTVMKTLERFNNW